MRFFWYAFRKRGALLHFHDPELLFVFLILKFLGRPVIFDCHEDFTQKAFSREWVPRSLKSVVSRAMKYLLSFAGRHFNAVVVAAPSLLYLFPKAKNLNVIRNVSSVSEFELPGISDRVPRQIFYSGGLTPDKGIENVIDAVLTSLIDMRLVIVGREAASVRQRLGEKLNHSRVDYRGIVSYTEIKRLMRTSHVGVVCNQPINSYGSALPNKLFEYLAAGLPVVYSNFEHWANIFGSDNVGNSVDPTSIASIRDETAYVDRVSNCRKVARVHDWDHEIEKLIDLYQTIAERVK